MYDSTRGATKTYARSRSVSPALVKAFQVFHPTEVRGASPLLASRRKCELVAPWRKRRYGGYKRYFRAKSRMNRGACVSRLRDSATGGGGRRPEKTRAKVAAQRPRRAECTEGRAASRGSAIARDRRLEKRLFKETRMNTISALAPTCTATQTSLFHRREKGQS